MKALSRPSNGPGASAPTVMYGGLRPAAEPVAQALALPTSPWAASLDLPYSFLCIEPLSDCIQAANSVDRRAAPGRQCEFRPKRSGHRWGSAREGQDPRPLHFGSQTVMRDAAAWCVDCLMAVSASSARNADRPQPLRSCTGWRTPLVRSEVSPANAQGASGTRGLSGETSLLRAIRALGHPSDRCRSGGHCPPS